MIKITAIFLISLSVLQFISPNTANAQRLFNYIGFKASSLSALPKWVRVLNRLPYEQQRFIACDADPVNCDIPSLVSWRAFIQEQKGLAPEQQIRAVNSFINRWEYITDYKLWGRTDYWETPMEFLANSGDCEDYAIIKYVSLRELGFPKENLRIAVVQDNVRDIAHAILIVNLDGKTVVLDSLFSAVLEQRQLMQYTPYYAVNETSRWTYVPPIKFKRK